MTKKVAVVILNYNGRALMEKFLPSVTDYSGDAEIVVVDNRSTDDSVDFLRERFPDVRLIVNEENGGFAKGYNDGLKHVEAEYYMLLNSDVEVTPGWLDPIVRLLDSDHEVAAVQPKILSHAEPEKLEYAGAAGGYIDSLAYPFCRGRLFDHTEKDSETYADTRPVFWATGAALMVRSDVFRQLGGFDEDFFAHMEEVDLCWRIHRMGRKVYYCGESSVYHVGGGTLAQGNPRKTYLNFRNSLSVLYLNTKGRHLLWKMPLRLGLDMVAALRFFGGGVPGDGKAVLKAFRDFTLSFAEHRKKRKKRKKSLAFVSDAPTQYRGLIVFDYFVRKKSRFSDLGFQSEEKNARTSTGFS
ncbi:glycosyl transferase [Fulvitalea axinellae]|uniref:Glycosyl transferase n=1 Tax=Fulvitalea axinellae TaxID=1182444 RepID=A0AAU9CPJ2_9BACT|nr:glycosyl transferase [Fulvitalea axinellae]